MRTTNEKYFLDLALRCAHQTTCLRRGYGSIIVDSQNKIVSTGYNGSPAGAEHCSDIKRCWRKENAIKSGTRYEACKSVHSEMNALLQAGVKARQCKIYIAGFDVETGMEIMAIPCFLCSKMMVNSGIISIIYRDE